MRGRSVVEIMVLTFTFVVAFAILATGALVAILEIRDPAVDTGEITNTLLSIVAGILGALLGLLAGKSTVGTDMDKRPPPEVDWGAQTQGLYRRPNPGNVVPTWKRGPEEDEEPAP
jgi:hypothetical protein